MSLTSLQGEDDIVAKLRTIPGVDVIEGEYTPDGYTPPIDGNNMFKPYMLVKFNGGYATHDNGLGGPDKDTQRATFSVFVVSPDDRTSRDIRNQVRAKMLVNFVPTDASSLTPTGGYSFIDSDIGYQRYVHNVGFGYVFNIS